VTARHFEPCTAVRGKAKTSLGGGVTDTYFKHCIGPYETAKDTGAKFEPDDSPCYRAGDTHGGTTAPDLRRQCPVRHRAAGYPRRVRRAGPEECGGADRPQRTSVA
jgi:hypothetical protein